jgi:hypothetical protein
MLDPTITLVNNYIYQHFSEDEIRKIRNTNSEKIIEKFKQLAMQNPIHPMDYQKIVKEIRNNQCVRNIDEIIFRNLFNPIAIIQIRQLLKCINSKKDDSLLPTNDPQTIINHQKIFVENNDSNWGHYFKLTRYSLNSNELKKSISPHESDFPILCLCIFNTNDISKNVTMQLRQIILFKYYFPYGNVRLYIDSATILQLNSNVNYVKIGDIMGDEKSCENTEIYEVLKNITNILKTMNITNFYQFLEHYDIVSKFSVENKKIFFSKDVVINCFSYELENFKNHDYVKFVPFFQQSYHYNGMTIEKPKTLVFRENLYGMTNYDCEWINHFAKNNKHNKKTNTLITVVDNVPTLNMVSCNYSSNKTHLFIDEYVETFGKMFVDNGESFNLAHFCEKIKAKSIYLHVSDKYFDTNSAIYDACCLTLDYLIKLNIVNSETNMDDVLQKIEKNLLSKNFDSLDDSFMEYFNEPYDKNVHGAKNEYDENIAYWMDVIKNCILLVPNEHHILSKVFNTTYVRKIATVGQMISMFENKYKTDVDEIVYNMFADSTKYNISYRNLLYTYPFEYINLNNILRKGEKFHSFGINELVMIKNKKTQIVPILLKPQNFDNLFSKHMYPRHKFDIDSSVNQIGGTSVYEKYNF